MPVMAGSASFNSASTMREPVGGRHPCTGNCLPIGRGAVGEVVSGARGPSRMQRRGWCSEPGSPVSNRLARHELGSRDPGQFSMLRLAAMLSRRLRARPQRAMEQPSLRRGPKGSRARTEPNSHCSDRHNARRQIVYPSSPVVRTRTRLRTHCLMNCWSGRAPSRGARPRGTPPSCRGHRRAPGTGRA